MMKLKLLTGAHLPDLWQIAYSTPKPAWKALDAPYFQDYKMYSEVSLFEEEQGSRFVNNPNRLGIFQGERLVGTVSRYWECQETRWMELGLAIYQEEDWNAGIGTSALKQWLSLTFQDFPDVERLGLTTWSGNAGMMALAEKLGLRQEARIRKVRYYQGFYYDSLKYGILRDEWRRLCRENQEKVISEEKNANIHKHRPHQHVSGRK